METDQSSEEEDGIVGVHKIKLCLVCPRKLLVHLRGSTEHKAAAAPGGQLKKSASVVTWLCQCF